MKKLHVTLVIIAFLIFCFGCEKDNDIDQETKPEDNQTNDQTADSNVAPSEGEDCDFREFTPFCSLDHKAVNCTTFDGFSVVQCNPDEECVIGMTTGFFSKKPDAGCYKPCTADEVGKEISYCENDTNTYYKCEAFEDKYYYSDYNGSVSCDHGCNSEGTDCIKVSEFEYATCDIEAETEEKEKCDGDIKLECNYSRGDVYYFRAEDCKESGKTCARGWCVEKVVEDEYNDCDETFLERCDNNYKVYCGYYGYVTAYSCDEGEECIMEDGEPTCKTPCTESELGHEYGQCGCAGSCSTVHYVCSESDGGYYYKHVDADGCVDYCNDDKTACEESQCSVFYEPRCYGKNAMKICQDEKVTITECTENTQCVIDKRGNPQCLEPCSMEQIDTKFGKCECHDGSCHTGYQICTAFGEQAYLVDADEIIDCTSNCNETHTACEESSI